MSDRSEMYIPRHAESTLRTLSTMFGAVLVTGPRQVGKTTILEHVADVARHVTLDDPLLRASAVERTGTFLKDFPPPVFIDEVQYAPQLFPYIKMSLDETRKKGQFYMTGSQQFELMVHVTESLAGRIGLVMLLGLSLRERAGVRCQLPFTPTREYFAAREDDQALLAYDDVWRDVHRGTLPELALHDSFDWRLFYGSYVKTYIERDIRQLAQVGDETKFLNFMMVAASCTGQLLNMASLARDVGISPSTAERWLSILVTSGIAYLLKPYHNNLAKRVVKTPKLYFLDTGLAAYLTRWNTPDVLKSGAMAGAFFESFVIAEVLKSYCNQGVLDAPLYFYRDRDGNEIDLVIETDGVLHPVEIKKHADPSLRDISAFRVMDRLPGVKRGAGGVVCMYDRLITLSGDDRVIPVTLL